MSLPMLTAMPGELAPSQFEPAPMASAFGSTSSTCDHMMLSYVEHLGLALRNLSEAVNSIEARQSSLDERVIIIDGHMQGLVEQQCLLLEQQSSLEGLQKAVAGTARKALQTASVMQQQRQEQEFDECLGLVTSRGDSVTTGAWEAGRQRLQQHEKYMDKLTADVSMLMEQVRLLNREVGADAQSSVEGWNDSASQSSGNQAMAPASASFAASPVGLAASSGPGRQSQLALTDMALVGSEVSTATAPGSARHLPSLREENAGLRERLSELERGQRKVLAFAQQALKTTVELQKQQKEQREQQDHVSQILRESLQPALAETTQMAEKLEVVEKATDEFRRSCAAEVAELRSRASEVHQALEYSLASQQLCLRDKDEDAIVLKKDGEGCATKVRPDDIRAQIHCVEARVDRKLVDMSDRLQAIQEATEEQRLSNLQTNRQVPEIARRVDQLWSECQSYFSQVKAHEVHLRFIREDKLKALAGSLSGSSAPRSEYDFADGASVSSLQLLRCEGDYDDADDASKAVDDALAREGVGVSLEDCSRFLQEALESSSADHSCVPPPGEDSQGLPASSPASPSSIAAKQRHCNDDASSCSSQLWGSEATHRSSCKDDADGSSMAVQQQDCDSDAASDGTELWGGVSTRRTGGNGEATSELWDGDANQRSGDNDDAASHTSELWGGSTFFTRDSHEIMYANGTGHRSSRGARDQTTPEEAYDDGGRWLM